MFLFIVFDDVHFVRDFFLYRNQTILFILTCILIFEAMLEGVYIKELISPWWFDSHWFPPSKSSFCNFCLKHKLSYSLHVVLLKAGSVKKKYVVPKGLKLSSPLLFIYFSYFVGSLCLRFSKVFLKNGSAWMWIIMKQLFFSFNIHYFSFWGTNCCCLKQRKKLHIFKWEVISDPKIIKWALAIYFFSINPDLQIKFFFFQIRV